MVLRGDGEGEGTAERGVGGRPRARRRERRDFTFTNCFSHLTHYSLFTAGTRHFEDLLQDTTEWTKLVLHLSFGSL